VTADRFDRRRILIYTQWIMMLLAALTGTLLAAGRLELWHLYGVAFMLGIATAYELPAYQSFYPQLIAREELQSAIALNQASFNGSRIIGPAVAAWIVAGWGMAAVFFANAASFLAVIVSLGFIRSRPPATAPGRASVMRQMAEGLQYVRERPEMQSLLGLTAITTFFVFPNLAVLMPYYALHVINVGPTGLGTLMAFSGAGSLVGALLLLNVPRERRIATIAVAAAAMLAAMSGLAWSPSLWISVAAVVLQSLGISLSIGLVSIMIQESVPDALRGRVMSLYTLTFTGIMPFGALGIPAVAERIGMRWELQGAAVLYALGAAVMLVRLSRRRPA
jgi:MFS family permease